MPVTTVRFLGVFLAYPTAVPNTDLQTHSPRFDIADPDDYIVAYQTTRQRWQHISEIRERYSYRVLVAAAYLTQTGFSLKCAGAAVGPARCDEAGSAGGGRLTFTGEVECRAFRADAIPYHAFFLFAEKNPIRDFHRGAPAPLTDFVEKRRADADAGAVGEVVEASHKVRIGEHKVLS